MTTHPATSSQQPSKSTDDPEYWEGILRDAGLPSEPPRHHQLSSLRPDSTKDFGDDASFFDRNSPALFEMQQKWKRAGFLKLVCDFCACDFWGRAGTKYCSDNHRKRHNEGKVFSAVPCAGCDKEIHPLDEPYIVDGKKHCSWCEWCLRRGWKSAAEYTAFCAAQRGENSNEQQ
jgi:hypothetical protein